MEAFVRNTSDSAGIGSPVDSDTGNAISSVVEVRLAAILFADTTTAKIAVIADTASTTAVNTLSAARP
jgi:hypothetical protein